MRYIMKLFIIMLGMIDYYVCLHCLHDEKL